MLNSLCDDVPNLTDEEIQARCQAIRMNWSGAEKVKRKLDGKLRMRDLDRTLRRDSFEVSPSRSYAGVVRFAQVIAG